MKMTFRWYGSKSDPIPLKYVKQIPGMTGLMGLLDKPAGVDWPEDEFVALKKESFFLLLKPFGSVFADVIKGYLFPYGRIAFKLTLGKLAKSLHF